MLCLALRLQHQLGHVRSASLFRSTVPEQIHARRLKSRLHSLDKRSHLCFTGQELSEGQADEFTGNKLKLSK